MHYGYGIRYNQEEHEERIDIGKHFNELLDVIEEKDPTDDIVNFISGIGDLAIKLLDDDSNDVCKTAARFLVAYNRYQHPYYSQEVWTKIEKLSK